MCDPDDDERPPGGQVVCPSAALCADVIAAQGALVEHYRSLVELLAPFAQREIAARLTQPDDNQGQGS